MSRLRVIFASGSMPHARDRSRQPIKRCKNTAYWFFNPLQILPTDFADSTGQEVVLHIIQEATQHLEAVAKPFGSVIDFTIELILHPAWQPNRAITLQHCRQQPATVELSSPSSCRFRSMAGVGPWADFLFFLYSIYISAIITSRKLKLSYIRWKILLVFQS